MKSFLIIDDHPVVRNYLKITILDNYPNSTVCEANSEKTSKEIIGTNHFDLIILDLNMPDSDPIKMIDVIKYENSKTPILIFTSNEEDSYSFRLLKLGIKGYLTKWASDDEVVKAIDSTLNNQFYVSENMKEKLAEFVMESKSYTNPFDRLNTKEFEIALAMLKGSTTAEISAVMGIKPGSMSIYKNKIFEKLEIEDNSIVNFVKKGIKYKVI